MALAIPGPAHATAPIPPGRQHRLTIEGDNTVKFLPQMNRPDVQLHYKASFEYIVNTWDIKETKTPSDTPSKAKSSAGSTRSQAKIRESAAPEQKPSREVDLSLHSSQIAYSQDGQPAIEVRMSRNKFQGRLQPDAPILNLGANAAPPPLKELLKLYDSPAATLLINQADRVVDRKIKVDGLQRPVIETILSIHSPMPRDRASWEAESRLAMGQGQTARGQLRFEKIKPVATNNAAVPSTEVVRVKVTGTLKGEGIVAGNLVKDGTYQVNGEQSYDLKTLEWIQSRWTIDVVNELANQTGLTIARTKGQMIIGTRTADDSTQPVPEDDRPKL